MSKNMDNPKKQNRRSVSKSTVKKTKTSPRTPSENKRKYDHRDAENQFESLFGKKPKLATTERPSSLVATKKPENAKLIFRFENLIQEFLKLSADDIQSGNSFEEPVVVLFQQICSLGSQMKSSGSMTMIDTEQLVKLLNTLACLINCTVLYAEKNEMRFIDSTTLEVVTDATLICLLILTSPKMTKKVYLEDVIDAIISFVRHCVNSITSLSDRESKPKKEKTNKYSSFKINIEIEYKNEGIKMENLNVANLVGLINELLSIQVLTDGSVIDLFSMALSGFFIENHLRPRFLQLMVIILIRYELLLPLVINRVFIFFSRLPQNCRVTVTLKRQKFVHFITYFLLEVIHGIVAISDDEVQKSSIKKNSESFLLLSKRYSTCIIIVSNFLTVFLNEWEGKKEDSHKTLFESFVQDLLVVLNNVEWPAAYLVVKILGRLLMKNFRKANCCLALKIGSLDLLGQISSVLREKIVFTANSSNLLEARIREIHTELKENCDLFGKTILENPIEKVLFLKLIFMKFLNSSAEYEFVKKLHVVLWYRDIADNKRVTVEKSSKVKTHSAKKKLKNSNTEQKHNNETKAISQIKRVLLQEMTGQSSDLEHLDFQNLVDYELGQSLLQTLASEKLISENFDLYLEEILSGLTREQPSAIRVKALKCLTMVVEVDVSLLSRPDIESAVSKCILDPSTCLREASVDLLGKCLKNKPEILEKYYQTLLSRSEDSAVSVRKRVVRIFNDICLEARKFSKIPEIRLQLLRRVIDEESIMKLVVDMFKGYWFDSKERGSVESKVKEMVDMLRLDTNKDNCLFIKLLSLILRGGGENLLTEEDSKCSKEVSVYQRMIECLVKEVANKNGAGQVNENILAGLNILFAFANVIPKLLTQHFTIFLECLSNHKAGGQTSSISKILNIMELLAPHLVNLETTVLRDLEECFLQVISGQDKEIVENCLGCLNKIMNQITKDFSEIQNLLSRYHSNLKAYRKWLEEKNYEKLNDSKYRQYFRRSLVTTGLILRHIDFKEETEMKGFVDQVFELLILFLKEDDMDIKNNALKTLGNICVKYPEYMLKNDLKSIYYNYLVSEEADVHTKIVILTNINDCLVEEDNRNYKKHLEDSKKTQNTDLKVMDDNCLGINSVIIQFYMNPILQCYLNIDVKIRKSVQTVVQVILAQGLSHPVQIIPSLVCMSSDTDESISNCATQHLFCLEKKFPGFIQSRISLGIELSFRLHSLLQNDVAVRGVREADRGKHPVSINNFMYCLMQKSKRHRRALMLGMLKKFEDQSRASLPFQLYLADNLAHFPYIVQDEPLFVMHNIDTLVSIVGANLLESFKQVLAQSDGYEKSENVNQKSMPGEPENGENETHGSGDINDDNIEIIYEEEDEDEDEELLLQSLPEDISAIEKCLENAQGCFLLLLLKKYLKEIYSITDHKVKEYSPALVDKIYEKPVSAPKNRKMFNPVDVLKQLKADETKDKKCDPRKYVVSQYVNLKTLILEFN